MTKLGSEYYIFSILGLIIFTAWIFYHEPSTAQVPLLTINTQNGSQSILSGGTLNFVGEGTLKVISGNQSRILFVNRDIYAPSPITQHLWDSTNPQQFLDAQMNQMSSYRTDVKIGQSNNGFVHSLAITPISNVLTAPVNFVLTINGVPTNDILTIKPGALYNHILTINEPFNKGDVVVWRIITTDTSAKGLLFNSQVFIIYKI
jgi:hypothetical protein